MGLSRLVMNLRRIEQEFPDTIEVIIDIHYFEEFQVLEQLN